MTSLRQTGPEGRGRLELELLWASTSGTRTELASVKGPCLVLGFCLDHSIIDSRHLSVCGIIHLQFIPNLELRSFEFLLVFCILQVGISLLGEVNRLGETVDNLMSHGAKIAGFGSLDVKPDWCVVLHQNDSYHHLTEDRDPYSHQVVFRAKVYRQVHIYSLVCMFRIRPIV